MKFSAYFSIFAFGVTVFLTSCGKDAAETVASAVTAKVSCNYQAAGWCGEFLVDNYAGSDQQTCTQAGGTYAASACPNEGKIKGCALSTNGLKVSRTWAYNTAGVAAVEGACNVYINQNNPSLSAEFVTP